MDPIRIPTEPVSQAHLDALEARALECHALLVHHTSEVKLPIFIEITGSPKAGKSSVISKLFHFFRRNAYEIIAPPEGISRWSRADLGDELLASNTHTLCYTLNTIFYHSFVSDPPQLVILDRGLFDTVAWYHFLLQQHGISPGNCDVLTDFCMLNFWLDRQQSVFLFTCDASTSLRREHFEKLTAKVGRKMNDEFLADILEAYATTRELIADSFSDFHHLDSSFHGDDPPNLQHAAYLVANSILDRIESMSRQDLLVMTPADFRGFKTEPAFVQSLIDDALASPRFAPRHEAEQTHSYQQLISYALVEDDHERYLCVRRKDDPDDPALQGRYTILMGGHVEKKDWDSTEDEQVLETCLRRELDEELHGLNVESVERLGVINEPAERKGAKHCAIIFRVRAGGRASIRKQAIDEEFGNEPLEWMDKDSIVAQIDQLDPWSQFAAAKLFNVDLPASRRQQGLLFVRDDD